MPGLLILSNYELVSTYQLFFIPLSLLYSSWLLVSNILFPTSIRSMFIILHEWDHVVFVFLCLFISFDVMIASLLHVTMDRISFYGWIVFHYLCISPFLWFWGLNTGPKPWATPPALYLCFFQHRVSCTICRGWLWNRVLLVFASSIARIIAMSHWYVAWYQWKKIWTH
jgi:hypothetical protein